MEPNRTLHQVIKSDSEKIKTILENVTIMLGNRIFIDKNGEKRSLLLPEKREAIKRFEDRGDGIFVIKTENGENYAIKIVFQRITAIGKQSVVNEFFKDYTEYKKIIVAREFNNKISDHVSKHQTQIFRESALLENIIDHNDQPRFELLTPAEMDKVKSEYNATDYTIKKYAPSDPVVKYFALKKGDIIRIIRPSPTAGEVPDYRIVKR